MNKDIEITFNSKHVSFMMFTLENAYHRCSLNLNNEIAHIIRKVKFNKNSYGIFGSTDERFYKHNKPIFEDLRKNVQHRKNIILSYTILCDSYNEVITENRSILNSIKEDNETMQRLLDELGELIIVGFGYKIEVSKEEVFSLQIPKSSSNVSEVKSAYKPPSEEMRALFARKRAEEKAKKEKNIGN